METVSNISLFFNELFKFPSDVVHKQTYSVSLRKIREISLGFSEGFAGLFYTPVKEPALIF